MGAKIDKLFEHKGVNDHKAYTYAVLKLSKLGSLWFDIIQMRREREGKDKISSWDDLVLFGLTLCSMGVWM